MIIVLIYRWDVTLAELGRNESCRIINAALDDSELQSRLYALGLYPGIEVEVLRFAPVGDPIQVRTGLALLSIRKQEAALIEVEKIT
ncbi:MAG TPA: ferrous iron transport protein A [Gammaproteobacteria bacterium]|nr:ferrous iron transport protein A [Gammaproteobacteria bacterium]|tara:strand:+ start:483 stop:743 length:261 start_codon:yes stop_codon:yes gene_type:complete